MTDQTTSLTAHLRSIDKQVLTLVDLRNEVNMDLLRQRVRPLPTNGSPYGSPPAANAPSKPPPTSPPSPRPPPHVAVSVAPRSPARPPPKAGRWDHHHHQQRQPHHHYRPSRGGRLYGPNGRAHHPEDEPRLGHKQRPVDRASQPEGGCPLFAAGRVCSRSFFDVLFV